MSANIGLGTVGGEKSPPQYGQDGNRQKNNQQPPADGHGLILSRRRPEPNPPGLLSSIDRLKPSVRCWYVPIVLASAHVPRLEARRYGPPRISPSPLRVELDDVARVGPDGEVAQRRPRRHP